VPSESLRKKHRGTSSSLSFVIQSDSDRIYRRGWVAGPNHSIALSTSMRSLDEICSIV
jgi:hypothetical protein